MGLVSAFIDRQYPAPRVNRGFGAPPPNIIEGGCSQLPDGAVLGYANHIFVNGVDTGDWIDVDGGRLHSTGYPVCHGGSAYQDVGPATILSIPDDLRRQVALMIVNGALIATLEAAAQGTCVAAQRVTGFGSGKPLLDLWTQAQAQVGQAQTMKAAADDAYAQFKEADDAVGGAYSNGTYQDPTLGALVLRALTLYNHVPMAFDNVTAASQCVWDEFYDYAHDFRFQDFMDRYTAMEPQSSTLAAIFSDVQSFLEAFQAAASQVTLSQDASTQVAAATDEYKALTDLAGNVAASWANVQSWRTMAANGLENNIQNVLAVEQADDWIRQVQTDAGFPDAVPRAQDLAAAIHGRLDPIYAQLQAAGLDKTPPPPAKPSSGGHVLVGVGVVGALALLIKKGILFG